MERTANLEQLQSESLDLVQHAVEGGLVCERSAQQRVPVPPVSRERRERFQQRRPEVAAHEDL